MRTLIVSLNLNKGLPTPRRRVFFQQWLADKRPDVVLAQEPWVHSHETPLELEGFARLGGNSQVFGWINEEVEEPECEQLEPYVQRVHLSYVTLYNVYLSPYGRAERGKQLHALLVLLERDSDRPTLVLGDFNLAPRDVDGMLGSRISHFNGDEDRVPFYELMRVAHLVDATSSSREYSIVRSRGHQQSRFRCDLCLVSDYYVSSVSVKYDHASRSGDTRFTDHSALLAEVPVSLEPTLGGSGQLFSWRSLVREEGARESRRGRCSYKTAMPRARESPVARWVVGDLVTKLRIRNVLDHGCGHGVDVEYYRKSGLSATGYDPYPIFGFTTDPEGYFDLVISSFVLNVLPDPWERLKALRAAAQFVHQTGRLLVVARSRCEIEHAAREGSWQFYNDGYISSEGRDTFQRGIEEVEILELALRVGLTIAPEHSQIPKLAGATQVLLQIGETLPTGDAGSPVPSLLEQM